MAGLFTGMCTYYQHDAEQSVAVIIDNGCINVLRTDHKWLLYSVLGYIAKCHSTFRSPSRMIIRPTNDLPFKGFFSSSLRRVSKGDFIHFGRSVVNI